HGGRRDREQPRQTFANSRALVIREPEGAVAAVVQLRQVQGTAEGASELVLLERRLVAARIEEVIGVHVRVAQKMEQRAMEVVRAGTKAYVNGAAQRAAELGRQKIALYLELGDRVRTGQHRGLVIVRRVVVDAVQQEVIVLDSVAVDANQEVLVERVVSLRDVGAGRERDELNEVPPVEWQFRNGFSRDH